MSCRKVFVGSIPGHLTQEQIQLYFRRFVPTAVFKLHRKQKRSSGFGFIQNLTPHEQEVIVSIEHALEGRKLKCHPYLKGESLQQAQTSLNQRRIFIRGLPKSVSDAEIRDYFSQFGEIESVYQVKHPVNGKVCPFGFLTYKNEVSAIKVLQTKFFDFQDSKISCEPFQKQPTSSPKGSATNSQPSQRTSTLAGREALDFNDQDLSDESIPSRSNLQFRREAYGTTSSRQSQNYQTRGSPASKDQENLSYGSYILRPEYSFRQTPSFNTEGELMKTAGSHNSGRSTKKPKTHQEPEIVLRTPGEYLYLQHKIQQLASNLDSPYCFGRPDWARVVRKLEHTPENLVFNVRRDESSRLAMRGTAFAFHL